MATGFHADLEYKNRGDGLKHGIKDKSHFWTLARIF